MLNSRPIRRTLRAYPRLLLAVALSSAAHAQAPLPLQPNQHVAAAGHRLILKDGTYQIVRKYAIVRDRVRYISAERAGEWEELPVALVDWEATRKWEQDLATAPVVEHELTAKEAEDLEKAEAEERDEQRARHPEVAKGLALPDEDAVFALDTFHDKPELIELVPVDLTENGKYKPGQRIPNPLSGARASIALDGAHAKVHLHISYPAIYLPLDERNSAGKSISPTPAAKTSKVNKVAGNKRGTHSPASGYTLVRVKERETKRMIGNLLASPTGTTTHEKNVIPARVEALAGKHWLKITPNQRLDAGEYALIEILSATEISPSVWDFRIDPASDDNEGSIGPIE
jgi:hypothetical protein